MSMYEPKGYGYCPLETAYGHGGSTEYCTEPSYEEDGWCLDHLQMYGYVAWCPQTGEVMYW